MEFGVMKMRGVHVLVLLSALCLCQAWRNFPSSSGNRMTVQWCRAANHPCRLKLEVEEGPLGNQVFDTPRCSCPDIRPCPQDWQANPNNTVVFKLRTQGRMNMTVSLMFCGPVQPVRRCSAGDVALQLSGNSVLPTEIDYVACSCTDPRPLVLHSTFVGRYHRNYQNYVCSNHKRRCNIGLRRRDVCVVTNQVTRTDVYPCKCPYGRICQGSPYDPQQSVCRPDFVPFK